MRVISGLFKGRKIILPKDSKTRPLKDLTKESIFNVISHSNKFKINLKNSKILDLFSGVGSFGIECLSRGAKKVVFVENHEGVLPILKKNLSELKLNDNYEIIEKNVYEYDIFFNNFSKFNIIFLDPPFKDKNINDVLINITKLKLLYKNGIIIIHRHKNEKSFFPQNIKIIEEKKYGISKIIFVSILN